MTGTFPAPASVLTPRPASIADYAVVGGGRSVALIAPDGTIDWWAAPALDSPPVLSELLDPELGGHFTLAAREVETIERAYEPGTNVLRTTIRTATGVARVTDALNSGVAGRLPWVELARRVDGLEGRVELDWELVVGSGLRSWAPWTQVVGTDVVLHADAVTLGLRLTEGVTVDVGHGRAGGRVVVEAGDRELVGVVAAHDQPLFLPAARAVDHRIDATIAAWQAWTEKVTVDGPYAEAVRRSALALKLLVSAETGSIAAAATTSLPERIGGDKNWDTRYAWVRDVSFTAAAMLRCGLDEEVHAALSWMLAAIRTGGMRVMFTLDGRQPPPAREVPIEGFQGSRPVRVGNDAAQQLQLGIFGDLLGTVTLWVGEGNVLDVATRRQLADIADLCADTWRQADAGLWELEQTAQYTSSKIGCWRALRCAAALEADGVIAGNGERWRREAEIVRSWIEEHCWSERLGAYTACADSEELDAAVLLAARFGFDTGPRMSSTIDALERELGAGGLLYRYTGVAAEEECFVACSYWMVEALALCGRQRDGERLMDSLAGLVPGALGLMSEMVTPGGGPGLGNMPQALSHLAHINAAVALGGGDRGQP